MLAKPRLAETDRQGEWARTPILRRLAWSLLVLVTVFALLAGCSGENLPTDGGSDSGADGGSDSGGDGGGGEPAPEPEPEPEPEPAPEPSPEPAPEPAPEDGVEDGLSSEDWLIIALLGVAGIAIVIFAMTAATKRSDAKQATRAALHKRLSEIAGSSRWIHDQGSLDVMRATDPQQLQSVWNGVRTRMVDLEGHIAMQAATISDPTTYESLVTLQNSIAGLRGALESDVATRLDPNADDRMRQSSGQTVYARRQQLQAAIGPVAMAQS